MTDYLDKFTTLESGSVEDCYGWRGWTIYWDKHALTGELCGPDGDFIAGGDSLEALEAARSAPALKVLYEGEAAVLKHGILLSTLGARIAMRGHKRVHIVVTALEDDES